MPRPSHCILLLLAVVGLASSASVASPPVQMVFAIAPQAPSSPKSAIPGGIPGVTDARFTNFNNKMYRSPTTNQWLVVATTNATPATADQVLVIGSGLSCSVAAREGVTEFAPGQFLNFSRLDTPRINDSGQYAIAFRIGGTATAADEKVVKWSGSAFELIAAQGVAIPAIPGATYGGSCNGAAIDNEGKVSFLATTAPTTGTNDAVFTTDGGALLVQPGVTIPAGQSGGPSAISDIDTNILTVSADGLHYAALGRVGSDANIDRVVIVDGVVVLQKGTVIPFFGPASPVSTIVDALMESNGDWYARGTNADGVAWVVRNGFAVAQTGAPVVPGSPENWELFRDVKGNNHGDYVISGNTTNANTLIDDVVVLNGSRVLARESDPVDVDGNGQLILYIHLIQDKAVFNNDGYYYFATRMKSTAPGTTGAGGSNNSSLLRVFACMADFNNDGLLNPDDLSDYINAYFNIPPGPGADFNGRDGVNPDDLSDYINAYFEGCG